MNGFVSLINALAWPAATFAMAVLFRREFRMALGRLGQVKYGGMEVLFREDLRQAEALARASAPAQAAATPAVGGASAPASIVHEAAAADTSELAGTLVGFETSTDVAPALVARPRHEWRSNRDLESLLATCEGAPREAVLDAWEELRRALVHASTVLGDRRAPAPLRADAAARFLVDRGWIGSVEGHLIDRLRLLADRVERHEGAPIDPDDARRFVQLAAPLIARIVALG